MDAFAIITGRKERRNGVDLSKLRFRSCRNDPRGFCLCIESSVRHARSYLGCEVFASKWLLVDGTPIAHCLLPIVPVSLASRES